MSSPFGRPAGQGKKGGQSEEDEDDGDICLICGKDGDASTFLHCPSCSGDGSGIGVYHRTCVKAPPNTVDGEVKARAPTPSCLDVSV